MVNAPELQWLNEGSSPSAVPNQNTQTMDTRLVNIVELASELAEEELNEKFGDIMLYEDDGEDGSRYTEKAQPLFDASYDKYYAWIDSCSQ